jgi:hypothetical protein
MTLDLPDTEELADQGRDIFQDFTDCKPNYNSEKSKKNQVTTTYHQYSSIMQVYCPFS